MWTHHNNQHINNPHAAYATSQLALEYYLNIVCNLCDNMHSLAVAFCFFFVVVVVMTAKYRFIKTIKTPASVACNAFSHSVPSKLFHRKMCLLDWSAFVAVLLHKFQPKHWTAPHLIIGHKWLPFVDKKMLCFLHIRYVWQSKPFIIGQS